jgi:hypothetical protein
MIIANPIYDVVFKRLMENEKVAKFFIGTLIEQVIESVEMQPQEFTYSNKLAGLAVFRLDFIAMVKTAEGEVKKILIEIQKAQNPIDVMRFRNYLAEQYKKEDAVASVRRALPITTIYILGFNLADIESPCIKVERTYKDLIHKTLIPHKNEFIEQLTHDSFVVQVKRITNRYQTRLDKLLSIFEQRNFTDSAEITKDYPYTPDVEEVQIMMEILRHIGGDPEERKQIEIEQEAWRTVNAMFAEKEEKYMQKLAQKDQELSKAKQELSDKDQELREKERLIAELMNKLNENP